MSLRTFTFLAGLLVIDAAGAQQRTPEAETAAFNAARALQNTSCLERCEQQLTACTIAEKPDSVCDAQRRTCTQACPGAISK